MRPHRWQPTGLPHPWDFPGKNTGVGCHFLLQCVKVKSESEVAQSCLTLSNTMDCSLPGPSIHGIPGKSTGVGCHCLLRHIVHGEPYNKISTPRACEGLKPVLLSRPWRHPQPHSMDKQITGLLQVLLALSMNFYFCSEIFLFLRICTSPPPSSSAQSFLLQEGFLDSPRNMNFLLLRFPVFFHQTYYICTCPVSLRTHTST